MGYTDTSYIYIDSYGSEKGYTHAARRAKQCIYTFLHIHVSGPQVQEVMSQRPIYRIELEDNDYTLF